MSWIDKKYINLLSSRLEQFKWRGNVANCRCPICFDSETHKNKKRGYFFEAGDHWNYFCHKCGKSTTVATLIKMLDSNLYKEYVLELTKDKYKKPVEVDFSSLPEKRIAIDDDLKELQKLHRTSALPDDHPAVQLLLNRKIPELNILRYVPNFMEWTNKLVPGKFSKEALRHDEGRIIIPFFNKKGKFHAYQGRSLEPKAQVRYISVVLDETVPLIWGLDRVRYDLMDDMIYAFEGVFDAIFFSNSIAICGSNFSSIKTAILPRAIIMVYDNEPRSIELKKKIHKAILEGFLVCIWPNNIKSKDVNDMILNEGLTPHDIKRIIDNNTFSGLKAINALTQWSKR